MPPVSLLACAFALGIALAGAASPPRLACAALVAVATASLLLARRAGRHLGLAALAQSLALGALSAALAWPAAPAGLVDGEPWDVTARVDAIPERAFGRTHVTAALVEVARPPALRARAAAGRVRIAFDGDPVEPLLPGDLVRFRARLAAPRGFLEPDSPDPAKRHAERDLVATCGLPDAGALVRLLPPGAVPASIAPSPGLAPASPILPAARADGDSCAGGPSLRGLACLRLTLIDHIAAHLQGERRALVESLILGERARVPRDLDDAFRAAGVNHVLSVSGLHLAMAAFLLLVALRRALVRITPLARRVAVHRLAAASALPATLAYAVLTGAAVATLRALVVAWVFLFGVVLGRPALALAALGAAALVLLGASPLALYDPSLQLSFAAALGASLLAPPAMRALRRGFLDEDHLRARAARFALGLLLTSAAAIAATAPLTAWHFSQVAPAGLIANLAVVPIAELWVMPAGLAGCGIAPISDGAGGLLLGLAGAGAAAMAACARFFAHAFPAGKLRAPTLLEALLWYAVLAAMLVWLRARRRAAVVAALAFAAALALAVTAKLAVPRLLPALTVDFLDVGQGDAAFVRLPDGRTLLVDGGGAADEGAAGGTRVGGQGGPQWDPGLQILVPWLERRGVDRVDYVVLTHPHPDHAGGLAAVVERFPVAEVWTSGAASALPALARLEAAAAARGVPVVRPHPLDGPATVDVLAPKVRGAIAIPAWFSENDGSVVLRLSYRGRAVLLTGDIERFAESRLVGGVEHPGLLEALHADVVKAPHHGSGTSSTPGFIEATAPRAVVFSAGAGNRWGFPNRDVLARWRAAGASLFRIDRDGAVTVRIGPRGGLSVETVSGGAARWPP